ncbi:MULTISPECIES: protease pro-enzyme activation domain-containing protein [unclassified Streptomyces]|uniref:S53 family peptidase n=1 Tax=unclassified Streptomyces TaxID=2593676 RepID=UPI002254C9EB|nr:MULTISPECIES: S53 family peptidase [unclassified Streptomyces]MCX5292452.1 S53 family peptidase [Streptomyces sp. NBC_00183]
MDNTRLVPLRGSERSAHAHARSTGAVSDSERIEVTLVLRRRSEIPDDLVEGPETITREELAARYGAGPADIDMVKRTAEQHGLTVTQTDPAARRVKISGTLGQLRSVVQADSLTMVTTPDPADEERMVEHRQRTGDLRILPEWDGVVIGVTGLDNRPQARPHIQRMKAHAVHSSYSPVDLGKIYRFPPGTDGSGHTIGVVELGGGIPEGDLDAYFAMLGIPTPRVDVVEVGSGSNAPGDPADGEVMLDIEVIGALAPGARQVVYFAENSAQGFADAVSTAVFADPTPTAVSISWGQREDLWTAQGRAILDAALADAAAMGVTVCVASGDNGSSDGDPTGKPHTDFPASSPRALACGGTHLEADPATSTVNSESVWNNGNGSASGGGVSRTFMQPSWQANVGVPNGNGQDRRRGVPDVAADADPKTGYRVLIHGRDEIIGGTSAVAPLWAALTVRLAEALGHPFGMLQPVLYDGAAPGVSPAGFRDITLGDIGGFAATPGWDACTGLGVPDGQALLARLASV